MFGFSYDEYIEHDQNLLGASLEIYYVFQDLSKIAKASNSKYTAPLIADVYILKGFFLFLRMCGDLQFLSYQSWFASLVSGWLKMALMVCKEKIAKAIQTEKVRP